MPKDGIKFIPHDEILNFDEIIRLVKLSVKLGIKKIKITGGEPLVRKDIIDLIKSVKSISGIEEVTITTNGLLLNNYIKDLYNLGIDGINVSLDAIDKEKFKSITRYDKVDEVIKSILKSEELGIKTKINTLIMPNINEDQILPIVEMAKDRNIHIRFIEIMPIGKGKNIKNFTSQDVMNRIESTYGKLKAINEKIGNGPAKYFMIDGFRGNIGFISAISNCFCNECNRVRLTSTGFLKACLQYNYGIELKPLLRGSYKDEDILDAMSKIIYSKPKEHQFNNYKFTKSEDSDLDCGFDSKFSETLEKCFEEDGLEDASMSSIGG